MALESLDHSFSASVLSPLALDPLGRRRFCARLERVVEGILREPLQAFSAKCVRALNELGHSLVPEAEDPSAARFRFVRPLEGQAYATLVVFEAPVSVLFAAGGARAAPRVERQPPRVPRTDLSRFSREALMKRAPGPDGATAVADDLQGVLEGGMRDALWSPLEAIVVRLNELGHDLRDLNDNNLENEIDYRGSETALHLGLTCIATVDLLVPG